MSFNTWAWGTWGFILKPPMINQGLFERMHNRVLTWSEPIGDETFPFSNEDDSLVEFTNEVIEALLDQGIVVPDGATLSYVGGDCEPDEDTEPDGIYIGIGMFVKPWEWPLAQESFTSRAILHTWVVSS